MVHHMQTAKQESLTLAKLSKLTELDMTCPLLSVCLLVPFQVLSPLLTVRDKKKWTSCQSTSPVAR